MSTRGMRPSVSLARQLDMKSFYEATPVLRQKCGSGRRQTCLAVIIIKGRTEVGDN